MTNELDDIELDDYERQEMRTNLRKWQKFTQEEQARAGKMKEAEVYAEAFKEIKAEFGLEDDRDLGEILGNVDPDYAKGVFKENLKKHMRELAAKSRSPKARRERDRDGRFVSTKTQAQSGSRSEGPKDVDAVLKRLFPKDDKFLRP